MSRFLTLPLALFALMQNAWGVGESAPSQLYRCGVSRIDRGGATVSCMPYVSDSVVVASPPPVTPGFPPALVFRLSGEGVHRAMSSEFPLAELDLQSCAASPEVDARTAENQRRACRRGLITRFAEERSRTFTLSLGMSGDPAHGFPNTPPEAFTGVQDFQVSLTGAEPTGRENPERVFELWMLVQGRVMHDGRTYSLQGNFRRSTGGSILLTLQDTVGPAAGTGERVPGEDLPASYEPATGTPTTNQN